MASAYSQRFALQKGGAYTYTVPSLKKAVVKCVTLTNDSATAGGVSISISGVLALLLNCAPGTSVVSPQLTIVARQGEPVAFSAHSQISFHASGYLLDDS